MARKRSKNKVVTITSKGTAVSALGRSRIPAANLGTFNPETGRVYQRPRQKVDYISGKYVTVTNPAYAGGNANKLTASIGMKGAGQKKRYM